MEDCLIFLAVLNRMVAFCSVSTEATGISSSAAELSWVQLQ